MSKPIIGVVEWPYTDADGDKVFEVLTPVINSISKSGGIPIGIFPTQAINYTDFALRDIPALTINDKNDMLQTLKMCDAVIKPGATKIYEYERFIYSYIRKMCIPYIGICAGMQTMCHYGNENIKNIKNNDNGINHHSKEDYAHSVTINKFSKLYDIIGKGEILVNSYHRYHVPNAGLNRISASAPDGIIEAVENPDAMFEFGLQWHPELMPSDDENSKKIFDSFIDAAYTYKKHKW
jgi:putative glutamine amidotransferase